MLWYALALAIANIHAVTVCKNGRERPGRFVAYTVRDVTSLLQTPLCTTNILHFLHSSLLVFVSHVKSVSKHSSLLSCIICCQTAMVYKDSPHSHQSSPEEDSSRSRNIETKSLFKPLGCLLLKCLPRTARSNDGQASYFTEVLCFLASQR